MSAAVSDARRPRVSVVIPCFNHGRFLAQAVDSALPQLDDLEVIIIDDCSTDNTSEVARSYAHDPRVRYRRRDDTGGSAAAKNIGIGMATGELVAFLDADDVWRNDKLRLQLPLFDDPKVGVVYARASLMDGEGRPIPSSWRGARLEPKAGDVLVPLLYDNFVPFSSSVVRRDLLYEVEGFDESLLMAMDWDLWLRLAPKAAFAFVDDEVIRYRKGHPGQMSANKPLRSRCSDEIIERMRRRHPELSGVIRRATAYRYAVRAYRLRSTSLADSTNYYLRSLSLWPLETAALKGLTKNLLVQAGVVRDS